jgi:hypothetical protein
MEWEDIVKDWLSKKSRDSCITELIDNLVKASAIPSAIAQNRSLLAVLLNQIILQTLKDLNVPEFPRKPLVFFDPYNGWIKKYENKKYDHVY